PPTTTTLFPYTTLFRSRDALGSLEGEPEPRRSLAIPAGEDPLVRRAIEGVVDLDGREALGVVVQHLGRRKLVRIEAALPFGIVRSEEHTSELQSLRHLV